MGSASSKAARRPALPTGLRVPCAVAAEPAHQRFEKPRAFDSKNEAVEKDAKDPHFMGKLHQLGPVRVDHYVQTVRAASDTQHMYRSRLRSEAVAASEQSTQNRLLASSLTGLLEGRKSVTDSTELEALAKRYRMDAKRLERISQVVNTPSIDEGTVVRTTDEHGEQSLTMMVGRLS